MAPLRVHTNQYQSLIEKEARAHSGKKELQQAKAAIYPRKMNFAS
jgi:hypothetical protein